MERAYVHHKIRISCRCCVEVIYNCLFLLSNIFVELNLLLTILYSTLLDRNLLSIFTPLKLTYPVSWYVSFPSGSMEPAFQRGDILFLHNLDDPIRVGEIVVFKIKDRDIPIVHRVLKVHEKADGKVRGFFQWSLSMCLVHDCIFLFYLLTIICLMYLMTVCINMIFDSYRIMCIV